VYMFNTETVLMMSLCYFKNCC